MSKEDLTDNKALDLLKEASIKFREAKKLEFRLFKTLHEGYVLLMRAIYPGYKSPEELKQWRKDKFPAFGQKDQIEKLDKIKEKA